MHGFFLFQHLLQWRFKANCRYKCNNLQNLLITDLLDLVFDKVSNRKEFQYIYIVPRYDFLSEIFNFFFISPGWKINHQNHIWQKLRGYKEISI